MKYLLKMANNTCFKEVDEYTFQKRKFALNDNLSPRYNGDWVMLGNDGTITLMELQHGSSKNLAMIIRGLNLPKDTTEIPGGFIREPNIIKFHKGNGKLAYLREKDRSIWNAPREKAG